jgi:hypothetical protein
MSPASSLAGQAGAAAADRRVPLPAQHPDDQDDEHDQYDCSDADIHSTSLAS